MAPQQRSAEKLGSMYTEQQTAALTDSSSVAKGMESDFNEFCNLADEWRSDDEIDGEEQVVPRIISASIVKTKDPVGIKLSSNCDSRGVTSAVVSSISHKSPFHVNNYAHIEPLREGDEILTINGHRVKDARRAAEMIRATAEGVLTVVASTAACGGEGGKRGKRRRMDGTSYHLIRLSTFVTSGGATSNIPSCTFRGMELEVKDTSSSLVSIKCIKPSSVFAKSGLKPGDILLTIDGCIVRTVAEALNALENDHDTDGINRVVSLLVYSLWDMRSSVIREELIGSSPNNWDMSLSCEAKQDGSDGEKECITLTMSETTVAFELIFDRDGTCSCPEPLAALKSFPQNQLGEGGDSTLGTESDLRYSRNEARSALELLFHRHIKQVVDAINYHTWRQIRLISLAMDARSTTPPTADDHAKKNYRVVSPVAPTIATNSLSSSCPSEACPKARSLLIFSDLEKAMASPTPIKCNLLYNVDELSAQEKVEASQHQVQVLHSKTNILRGLALQNFEEPEPSKAQANPSRTENLRAEESPILPNFNNEPPSQLVIAMPRPKIAPLRPKCVPPINIDNSSESGSSSEDSDDSSSEDTPPKRRSKPIVTNNKKKITPLACTELVVHQGDKNTPPKTQRKTQTRVKSTPATKATKSDPLLDIRKGQIRAYYKVSAEVVGIGAFGAVRFCSHRKTRKEFAVKSIPQNVAGKNSALLRNEVSILQQIKHKNVVRLVDLMQDDRFIHIVMEKCQGGDLFDKIMKDRVTFGEKIVSQIIRNVLDALEYLHERHIVHRDLKVSLKLLIYWLRASILLHCVSSMYCRLNT
jgi:hypothetical protein